MLLSLGTTLVAAVAGAALATLLKLPAAPLLGAMIGVAVVKLTSDLTFQIPSAGRWIVYCLVGWLLGQTVTRESVAALKSHPALILVVVAFAITAGVYGAAFVSYEEGSPLTYSELLVARPVSTDKDGRRVSITDIWVDSPASVAGGRELWAIPKGLCDFTLESASDLSALIEGGALPLELELISDRLVGPTLGAEAIDASIEAGIIGSPAIAASSSPVRTSQTRTRLS